MDPQQFQELIERYLSDQASPAEKAQLRRLLEDPVYIDLLEAYMDQQLETRVVPADAYPGVVSRLKKRMEAAGAEKKPGRLAWLGSGLRWAAAAAVIGALIIGLEQVLDKGGSPVAEPPVATVPVHTTIQPGKDGAMLTLADGRTIVLDSAGNGLLATQKGAEIVLSNGQVVYKAANASELAYNTLSTPKGRQFRVVLPDGTTAWLNAASSLRYPTAFMGAERRVEVTGEVYFEVARNKQKPFKVKVNKDLEIAVLGTHFNVNAYPGETSINTTLLEGSVQVTNGGQKALLKPGEQAQVKDRERIKRVSDVNLRKVMAWKNGAFDFDGASLQEVMRQLERWYDIEVVYEIGVPDLEFMGRIGRDLDLEGVLKGLKLSGVNFRLEGRKLTVLP